MAENGKSWRSNLAKSLGTGISLAILLVVQHYWNAATTQTTMDNHTQKTQQAVDSSKAETDRLLAVMKTQYDEVKAENVRLRVESDDRQRLITSLKLDVAELKKICGIKQLGGDNAGAAGGARVGGCIR